MFSSETRNWKWDREESSSFPLVAVGVEIFLDLSECEGIEIVVMLYEDKKSIKQIIL